jgi:polyferredoxin
MTGVLIGIAVASWAWFFVAISSSSEMATHGKVLAGISVWFGIFSVVTLIARGFGA